jgi:hypothetical protein
MIPEAPMKLISSRWTFFYKRVFPLLWFGLLAFIVVCLLFAGRSSLHPLPLPALLVPLAMAALGYAVMRQLVFDLTDQVWDEGDALLIRNAGREQRVPLNTIINVGYSIMTRPERVTLTLRDPGAMGKEITFSPPSRFLPFTRSPIITELIERVDRARLQSR